MDPETPYVIQTEYHGHPTRTPAEQHQMMLKAAVIAQRELDRGVNFVDAASRFIPLIKSIRENYPGVTLVEAKLAVQLMRVHLFKERVQQDTNSIIYLTGLNAPDLHS